MQEKKQPQDGSLGWEDPLQEDMATLSSILAWRILFTEKPGRPQSTGSQRVGHDWSDLAEHMSTQHAGLTYQPDYILLPVYVLYIFLMDELYLFTYLFVFNVYLLGHFMKHVWS